jgi:hypothetical protein
MWFEELGFVKNPYRRLDPYTIELDYLVWDRPDLPNVRRTLDRFIEDILTQHRTALRVFGPAGSGKTWITRIIQKEVNERGGGVCFIYTKIPKIEPTFQVVYRKAIEYFLENHIKKIAEHIRSKTEKDDFESWKRVIEDGDLATCLANIYTKSSQLIHARKWITGEKLTISELRELNITYSLDSDYDRFQMLIRLMREASKVFSSVILVVDELENAPVKLAGQIGDGLRDLLDEFSEKFALICSFTAQKVEEWYDHGYAEFLARRINYTIQLDSLGRDHISEFLRTHHTMYRRGGFEGDQLLPFNEDSVVSLLEAMPPEFHYPGYFLPNCEELARLAVENEVEVITTKFIESNLDKLPFVEG